jgi:hypothetical protein
LTEKPVQCGVLEKTRHIGITIEGVAAPTCARPVIVKARKPRARR